ncbi:MAG TPA: MerR family DNA-binding transcriptional regulator, partial [Thermomicrobiales bacterium]|nr:MerR family DNA-binding transcriptional regulator [Thermomicrobiales bacterium]
MPGPSHQCNSATTRLAQFVEDDVRCWPRRSTRRYPKAQARCSGSGSAPARMLVMRAMVFIMDQSHTTKLRIAELAAQLNLNPKTIRYYEQIGLVPAPARTPAGYRLYGLAEQDRLRFIV